MKITFNGAAKTVTGSQHLIEVNGKRILLDCGLFQGKRKEAFAMNRSGFCAGKTIDCVILSHAHIDHSGNIPCFVRNGFSGDIVCTSATRDLCAVMLMDSAHIQEQDVKFVNKRRKKNGQKPFEPLYTKEDTVQAMRQFIGLPYDRSYQVFDGIEVIFNDAGHLFGSANVVLNIHDKETNEKKRLLFSGDIGRKGIPIINDPTPQTEGADILIMESTYGNRTHPNYEDSEKELEQIVTKTYKRGGSLLIPAFSVGRTQQLVYSLHKLYLNRDIPNMPIYVDSPLATRVTDIFRLHPEIYDPEIRDFILNGNTPDAFGFETMRYTQTVQDSKELNFLKEPAVIISASGMMEAGRILHHLRSRIGDPSTTILVTGWQAPHTLGRRIVEREKTIKIYGEVFEVNAQVEVMTGFSGHADQNELVEWAGAMKKKPQRTFIVHGEEESSNALADNLVSKLGFENVEIPNLHQSFEV